ncbi:proton-coupled folate transporter-like [Tropilaelaps mercedesae]|uniref:Proton-coupled folate transporter-like n=1 Tax=Tropilaelaps mercedesae TaxID=418985 RepID=A0A1V9Y2U2_9ACAR|nr:proton-coupled folate transporter-like [Tropilaelaps mercedesae]
MVAAIEALRFVVEPVLFLTFMSMYMEVSLVQQLITRKVCLREFIDCEHTNSTLQNHAASPYITAYNAELSLLTLFVALWFGSWADKYGRRRMMILPSIGSILSTLNFIVASYFIKESPIMVMVSAGVIGCSTGTLGVSATCFGLVSDVTSAERRSTRVAVMEAMIFTGGALGFYIVGFMVPRAGFIATFSLELSIHLIILLYIIIVIREPERIRQHELSTTSVMSLHHVLSMARTITRPRENNYRSTLILLLFTSLMLSYGMASTTYIMQMFLKEPPLAWDSSHYSYYHGLLIAVQGCAIVIGLPICLRFFRMKDSTSGLLGALSRLVGLMWLAISKQSWMVYLSVVLLSMSEFVMPSVRSIISKIVGSNEKAQLFAFMSALQSFAFLTGSFLFTGLYNVTSKNLFPGFGFALAGSLQVIPVATFIYLHFALDVNALSAPLCTEEEIPRYDSTEESVAES